MNTDKPLFEKGDFTRIAEGMRQSGEELVAELGVGPGMDMLDLGCGDGTTALPAAARGANVLGVDITAKLLAAGRARAQAAGFANLRFEEGDAAQLDGIEDDSFDLVLSMFGAIFSPRPFDVARQMVRVTRPGGRIVMGNWIPGDPTLVSAMLKISASYAPPPAGAVSPLSWGVEENVRERFAAAGVAPEDIECRRATYVMRYPGPVSEMLEIHKRNAAPTINAYEAAQRDGRVDQLDAELAALFESQNQGGTETSIIPATYLQVVVQKK